MDIPLKEGVYLSVGINLLRISLVTIFATLFGFLYGYLSKKPIKTSEKIIVGSLNSILTNFGTIIFYLVTLNFLSPVFNINTVDFFTTILFELVNSNTIIYILLSMILSFIEIYFGIDYGKKTYINPENEFDKKSNGTFLDIKWYHFLWLWLPINSYFSFVLELLYVTFSTIQMWINFNLGKFGSHWYDIFLTSVSEQDEEKSYMDSMYLRIFFIYLGGLIILYLLKYLRKVLIGETNLNILLRLLVYITIGLILPIIIFLVIYNINYS